MPSRPPQSRCTADMVGRPRRYADLSGVNFLAPLHSVEFFISIAAFITIGAQFIFLFNFIYCLKWGKKAEENKKVDEKKVVPISTARKAGSRPPTKPISTAKIIPIINT